MSKNVVGSKIRSLRGKLNPKTTQDQLVARLQAMGMDIDQPTLSRIERGDRHVTDVEILAICEALGVDVEDLFKGVRLPYRR